MLKNQISLSRKLRNAEDLLDCFRIPMSRPAYNEFLALQDELGQFQSATQEMRDVWVYILGESELLFELILSVSVFFPTPP
jgi:hypothetical protein